MASSARVQKHQPAPVSILPTNCICHILEHLLSIAASACHHLGAPAQWRTSCMTQMTCLHVYQTIQIRLASQAQEAPDNSHGSTGDGKHGHVALTSRALTLSHNAAWSVKVRRSNVIRFGLHKSACMHDDSSTLLAHVQHFFIGLVAGSSDDQCQNGIS